MGEAHQVFVNPCFLSVDRYVNRLLNWYFNGNGGEDRRRTCLIYLWVVDRIVCYYQLKVE